MENIKTFQYKLSEIMDNWKVPHGHYLLTHTSDGLSVLVDTFYVDSKLLIEIDHQLRMFEINGTTA